MKTTYDWIRELVPDFSGDVEEMCERFTMSGTEVEHHVPFGDDHVIELAVTSNRSDCLGMVGLARDLAAATGLRFRFPDWHVREKWGPVEEACSVELEDAQGCPRYTAMVIEGVRVGESPEWLKTRLEAIGVRPINNVVDVTNYALFEMNQPFHAFDLDRVAEGKVIVRRARKGETIVALNDRTYALTSSMTVIADPEKPLAIAGVMGGASSEVGPETRRILLETAFFDPGQTRRTSRALGLSSDSSFRFERGVDAHDLERAAKRCAKLIMKVAGGQLRKGMVDVGEAPARERGVPFRHAQVERITGIRIPWARCREILEELECEVAGGADPTAPVRVKVPTWRPDLEREIDLVEEVIRIHGLDAIPESSGMPAMAVRPSVPERIRERIKRRLVAAGFHETMTTPFVSEEAAGVSFFSGAAPMVIRNAMRKDESALRKSLLPSLLEVRRVNQDAGNRAGLRFFEATVVYLPRAEGEIPEHLPIVSGVLDDGFAETRGAVELLAAAIGCPAPVFGPLDERAAELLDPARSATVRLGDAVIGHLGAPRDALVRKAGLRETPHVFELRLDGLAAAAELTPTFRPFSRFPAADRDLAMIVDEAVRWGEVEAVVRGLEIPALEALNFFDEYRGKQIGPGKKSLAFSLRYRSEERTLTSDEVDAWQKSVVDALAERLGAQIRDA